MKYNPQIETRIDTLLEKRGIKGHTAADRFISDFKAYICYYSIKLGVDAEKTVALLENDSNLTSNKIFYKNFRMPIQDLISPVLTADPIFLNLFKMLIDNKGKGVGVGELALPLIISGYRFSNDSDGKMDNGDKVEIKKNGASLKPVKTGLTDKGIVDVLNKKYFNGKHPGASGTHSGKKAFLEHVQQVSDPSVYADYFSELYVGCDITELAAEAAETYKDAAAFNTAVGKFALRNYKRVDGWNNIMYIDDAKMMVVNICDVDNIDDLGLKFTPKLVRGKDTQAISDGYVNVKI